jgi:uncharacterized protein
MASVPVVAQTTLLLTASNVFMPFAVRYMREPLKLDYLWAGLCLVGAGYFMFRSS